MLMSAGIGDGWPRGRTTLSFVCATHTHSQPNGQLAIAAKENVKWLFR